MADVTIDIKKEDGTTLTFTKKYINSVKSLSQSTTDAGNVQYGTIANSGSIELTDGDGYISSLIDDGTLPVSNLDVKVKLNGEVLQEHITTDSDYNTEDTSLSISMSNFIKDFDSLKYKGFPYPDESKTVYDLVYDVLYTYYHPQFPTATYPDFIDNMFDADLLTYIKNIEIEYPVIEYGKTYRQILDDLCTLGQMNMFADEQNRPKFVSARPIYDNNDTIAQLKWFDVVEPLKYTKTLKNKYDGVEMSKTNVSDVIDYDNPVYPASIDLSSTPETQYSLVTKDNQEVKERSQFISSATFYYEIVSYILSKYYTYSGTITIPKTSNNNLNQIQTINDTLFRTNDFAYSIKYNKYIGSVSADSVWNRGQNRVTVSNIVYGTESLDGQVSESGLVTDIYDYVYTLPDSTTTTSTSETTPNSPVITLSEDNDNFYVSYTICVEKKLTKLGGAGRWTSASTSTVDIPLSGSFENYIPLELEFTVYGNKRTITFEDTSASTNNIENAQTKATVNSSNLLQNTTTYNDTEIADIIKENILTDYRRGIQTGSLSLNANKVDVGDLIKYPDDNRVWRVTGKEFVYDGSIEFPLEIMQCLRRPSGYGLYDEDDNLITDWYDLVDSGLITINDTVISSVSTSLNGKLIIPSSVTNIGENAFNGCDGLIEITIPDNIHTHINCLYGCRNIRKLTTPLIYRMELGTVKYLPFYRLFGVNSNADIPESLTEVVLCGTSSRIGSNCFDGCSHIESIIIESDYYYTVSDRAFYGCSSLEQVTLSSSTSTIQTGAFVGCSSLTHITIPASTTRIEQQVFPSTYSGSLESVVFEDIFGWSCSNGYDYVALDLSDPETNAMYLTDQYRNYTWTKS